MKQKQNHKKLIMKRVQNERHWVGDGFYVSSMVLPDPAVYSHHDPFVMLDYAAPRHFEASLKPKGIGEHPHRGFETVTFAIQGEISHRDSGGGGGTIGAGEVQWMTAGSGLVHEEFFSESFTKAGGIMEMVQLWVNLPRKFKMTQPKYQGIEKSKIPKVQLAQGISAKVFAGELQGTKGPCSTFTQINVYELEIKKSEKFLLQLREATNTLCLLLRGNIAFDSEAVQQGELAVLSQEGSQIELYASGPEESSRLLVLNAEPINEPIVAHGPFVMNTKEEILQAIQDYQSGKMGRLEKTQ